MNLATAPSQTPSTSDPSPSHSRPQQQQPPLIQQQQQLPPAPPIQQQQHLQQQQQQQQLVMAMNGINGGNMPGGMVPYPTPAGHQAELNYIYGMVEELSRQLADNQRTLEEVVAGVGRVRSRARNQALGNEDLVNSAADEAKDSNLDTLISILSEALEKAKFSRDANAALLSQYASVVSTMLKQFHDYKSKHVSDVSAWHRSYRSQLAEARAENSRLREQIWEMQARAGHANEALRQFRGKYDEDGDRWERRVEAKAVRQELRFWKRMAMPHLPEDDPCWSDDDDLIDGAEKRRLEEMSRLAAEQQLAAAAELGDVVGNGSSGGNGDDDDSGIGSDGEVPPQVPNAPGAGGMVLGGVPMQREDSGAVTVLPILPPRPSSAASSTGSSGQ
ncbi:hypothetical protein B0J18DRAFT_489879 [Chaetomium sp. MPI-SDFR-AT-0129]|nr:hypothetical protein B0J18DRAFT_489879 [Chaetomium sp. MPI-SDFR-AT-0129]